MGSLRRLLLHKGWCFYHFFVISLDCETAREIKRLIGTRLSYKKLSCHLILSLTVVVPIKFFIYWNLFLISFTLCAPVISKPEKARNAGSQVTGDMWAGPKMTAETKRRVARCRHFSALTAFPELWQPNFIQTHRDVAKHLQLKAAESSRSSGKNQ